MAKTRIDYTLAENFIDQKVERGVRAAALAGQNVLVGVLSATPQRTGRPYARGAKTHVASAPGEPPAPDTGRLRNSLITEISYQIGGLEGLVATNLEYAAPLELGTDKIQPRPFMATLIDNPGPLFAAFTAAAKL